MGESRNRTFTVGFFDSAFRGSSRVEPLRAARNVAIKQPSIYEQA